MTRTTSFSILQLYSSLKLTKWNIKVLFVVKNQLTIVEITRLESRSFGIFSILQSFNLNIKAVFVRKYLLIIVKIHHPKYDYPKFSFFFFLFFTDTGGCKWSPIVLRTFVVTRAKLLSCLVVNSSTPIITQRLARITFRKCQRCTAIASRCRN